MPVCLWLILKDFSLYPTTTLQYFYLLNLLVTSSVTLPMFHWSPKQLLFSRIFVPFARSYANIYHWSPILNTYSTNLHNLDPNIYLLSPILIKLTFISTVPMRIDPIISARVFLCSISSWDYQFSKGDYHERIRIWKTWNPFPQPLKLTLLKKFPLSQLRLL